MRNFDNLKSVKRVAFINLRLPTQLTSKLTFPLLALLDYCILNLTRDWSETLDQSSNLPSSPLNQLIPCNHQLSDCKIYFFIIPLLQYRTYFHTSLVSFAIYNSYINLCFLCFSSHSYSDFYYSFLL